MAGGLSVPRTGTAFGVAGGATSMGRLCVYLDGTVLYCVDSVQLWNVALKGRSGSSEVFYYWNQSGADITLTAGDNVTLQGFGTIPDGKVVRMFFVAEDDTAAVWIVEQIGPVVYDVDVYAGMSLNDNATATTISTTDTYTKVGPAAATLNLANGFDMPSTCRLRYTGSRTTIVYVACTFSLTSAGSNDVVSVILYHNGTVNGSDEYTGGTALTRCASVQKLLAASDVVSSSVHVVVEMATNDYLELAVKNKTNADDLTVTDFNITVTAIPTV